MDSTGENFLLYYLCLPKTWFSFVVKNISEITTKKRMPDKKQGKYQIIWKAINLTSSVCLWWWISYYFYVLFLLFCSYFFLTNYNILINGSERKYLIVNLNSQKQSLYRIYRHCICILSVTLILINNKETANVAVRKYYKRNWIRPFFCIFFLLSYGEVIIKKRKKTLLHLPFSSTNSQARPGDKFPTRDLV